MTYCQRCVKIKIVEIEYLTVKISFSPLAQNSQSTEITKTNV